MIVPPTAGGAASIVRAYTVLGVDNPRGITFDGTHIHIADINDDNIRMILIPSADGEVSAVRTYTVSGLGNAQGMTFDGGLTSQAVLTLTTTDTDIRAGEAVDISIASDIDLTRLRRFRYNRHRRDARCINRLRYIVDACSYGRLCRHNDNSDR